MSFEPRYAIVTASDSGIGKATAVALANDGMDVGITWHADSAGAEATAEEVRAAGQKAYVAQLDTGDLPSCGDVVDDLAEQLGGLDVFVNNAGMAPSCCWTRRTTTGARSSPSTWTVPLFACNARPVEWFRLTPAAG
jgi:NAD(P)-dependent dehydrogenase (short-subunit alcohol dehydrogenase family)